MTHTVVVEGRTTWNNDISCMNRVLYRIFVQCVMSIVPRTYDCIADGRRTITPIMWFVGGNQIDQIHRFTVRTINEWINNKWDTRVEILPIDFVIHCTPTNGFMHDRLWNSNNKNVKCIPIIKSNIEKLGRTFISVSFFFSIFWIPTSKQIIL